MKLLYLFLTSVCLINSCVCQNKNDLNKAKIEYTANTRGFYQKIIVQNQMVTISKDRNNVGIDEGIKISTKDWKQLQGYFKTLKLEHLASLKAPSTKRRYDGAAIATFVVYYKDTSYQAPNFDHGNPPLEIKKIVNKINTFAKK